MRRPNRFFAALVTSAILVTTPLAAVAADDQPSLMERAEPAFAVWRGGVDIFILRPLGMLRLVVGTVVAMPFSTAINAAGWPISRDSSLFKDDFDKFIVEPWEYSFERRVGEDLAGL